MLCVFLHQKTADGRRALLFGYAFISIGGGLSSKTISETNYHKYFNILAVTGGYRDLLLLQHSVKCYNKRTLAFRHRIVQKGSAAERYYRNL